VESRSSTLRPLNGLLCQPRVIMIMEKSVEWLAGETEILGENLPQCRFVHHKPHMLCPDANPGRRGGKPASKRWATARPSVPWYSELIFSMWLTGNLKWWRIHIGGKIILAICEILECKNGGALILPCLWCPKFRYVIQMYYAICMRIYINFKMTSSPQVDSTF
jgi:hypothetical protein